MKNEEFDRLEGLCADALVLLPESVLADHEGALYAHDTAADTVELIDYVALQSRLVEVREALAEVHAALRAEPRRKRKSGGDDEDGDGDETGGEGV